MVTVLAILGVVLLLAFLLETLVEFIFGVLAGWLIAIVPQAEGKLGTYKAPFIQTVAVFLGIYGAFLLQFDILYMAGQFAELPNIPITNYGMAITGVAIGRGSSYIHQMISIYFPVKSKDLWAGGLKY